MIPVSIDEGIAALAAGVEGAAPLESATALTVAAITAQGRDLLGAIDAALVKPGEVLDAADPTGIPQVLVTGLLTIAESADDQSTLSDVRGVVGRAVLNIARIGT